MGENGDGQSSFGVEACYGVRKLVVVRVLRI